MNDRAAAPSEADASPTNSIAAPSSSRMDPVASRSSTLSTNGSSVWVRSTENVSVAASVTLSSAMAIRMVLLVSPDPKDNVAFVAAV